jgi:2-keto-3-deoxy-L-rhamnonate aldolase RhmA
MIPTGNPFKAALKAGKPQIGLWLSLCQFSSGAGERAQVAP